MPYISSFSIIPDKVHPFPYNIPSVLYARDIQLPAPVTFFIGDNGTGKSTLLETIAHKLYLPHIDGSSYQNTGFDAAKKLVSHLNLEFSINNPVGFFFRAEDFGDYLNSIDRRDALLEDQLSDLRGNVPDSVIEEMKENAGYQRYHMRFNYGQELQSFSHGEAYLHIMQLKLNNKGIFLLDEPEAALSPVKQLALLHSIKQHLETFQSQFIIATHSPILMAYPGATIYQITPESMLQTPLEETEHFSITKSFLNNPELYLRHLE